MRIVGEWKAFYSSSMLMPKLAMMSLSERFNQGQGPEDVNHRLAPSLNALTDHLLSHPKYSITQKLNPWQCYHHFRTSAALVLWPEVHRHSILGQNSSMSRSRRKSATLLACISSKLSLTHKTRPYSTIWIRGLRTRIEWSTIWCSRYSRQSRQPIIRLDGLMSLVRKIARRPRSVSSI